MASNIMFCKQNALQTTTEQVNKLKIIIIMKNKNRNQVSNNFKRDEFIQKINMMEYILRQNIKSILSPNVNKVAQKLPTKLIITDNN